MRIKPLLATAIALCLFAACKKNDDGSGSNGGFLRLSSYIEETHIGTNTQKDTFAVTYDNQGRLTSLVSPALKFQYAYNGNTSFTLDLFENGALSIHEISFINAGLHVDSTFQYNNTHDTTTEKYVYNGALATTKTTYDYTHAGGAVVDFRDTYTYDNNSNVTKDVQDDGNGNIQQTTTYTYTDKAIQISINPSYMPIGKNLPATATVTDGSGIPIGKVTYTYVFDNSGRLTQETDTQDNGSYVVKTYNY